MKIIKKPLFLFLALILMLNIILPSSISFAEGETEDTVVSTQESVTNDVYGESTKDEITNQFFSINKVEMYDEKPTYEEDEFGEKTVLTMHGNKLDEDGYQANADKLVAIVFDWELKDGHPYSDGSSYTFDLPDKFKVPNDLQDVLTGGVGDYFVNTAGKVTFTFNSSISGRQGYEGKFFVWIQFNKENFEEGLEQHFDFGSAGEIIVDFENKAKDKLTKTGVANKQGFNSDKIEWTLEFNQSEQEIKGAKLEDKLGDGLEIIGDIKITEMKVLIDGTLKETDNVKTISTGFPIELGNINKAHRVEYTTKVIAPTEKPFKDREYQNTVTLTGNNGTYNKSQLGKVSISFNEPLNKKAGKVNIVDTNPGSKRIIDWTIEFNYNQQTINKPIIKDIFDPSNKVNLKLVEDSFKVYKVNIDSNGKATRGAQINESQYELKISKDDSSKFDTGFILEFKDEVTEAYDIVYQTETEDRIYGDQFVKNYVTFENITKSDQGRLDEKIFKKNVINEYFNKKEIEWQLVLNEDKIEMSKVEIHDDYTDRNMELDPDSIRVNDQELDSSDFELLPGDYTQGFTLKLKDGKTINNKVIITYVTSFDPKAANKPADGVYKNKATLKWKDINENHTLEKEAYVEPGDYTTNNGRKMGEYSAKDKTITWTIIANYNLFDIKNAIITDSLTGDQTYIKDSFEVKRLILDTANNQVAIDKEYVPNYTLEIAADGKSFELELGDIGEAAYQIKYKTSLDGNFNVDGTYSNNAALLDGEEELFSQTESVTPKHGGQFLYKDGNQIGTSDKATWKVTLNPSQSYIPEGSVLTDTLSDNQILLKDSIKLYEANVPADNSGVIKKGTPLNENGNNDNDFFNLEVEGNTITLTFKKELTRAYILEYESYINTTPDVEDNRIKNEAKFQGKSSSIIGEEGKDVEVSLAGAGGGAATGVGKIKIVKLDDLNHPIQGVVFELWNSTGDALLETLTTDENGEATTTRNYRLNKTKGLPYILKEIDAPEIYLMDHEGKTINFKDSNETFKVVNKIIRQGFVLTKVDSKDSTKTLKGARFVLNQVTNSFPYVNFIDILETDDRGIIAKGDLEPGEYQLEEITAPDFYKKDSTPITFDIVKNQTKIVELTKPNVRGSDAKLIVTKVNAKDQSPIEGVEFDLLDSSDNVVAHGTTDENGLIEFKKLEYGKYTLVETKADGFVIEQADTEVSINEPETSLTIENKANDRSVKLTKYNSGKNQKLQGAVFELWEQSLLFDDEGEYLYQRVTDIDESKLTTDKNGELFLDDLEPNKYKLIEVKAPAGYLLNKTPVEFEITDTQTETMLVEKTNNRTPSTGGGGGGGGTPPVDPPTKPVDPSEEVDPGETDPGETDPGDTKDPGDANPGETVDPTKPINPNEGISDAKPEPGKPTKPKEETSDPGKTLPKTGESSLLPFQLTGLALIALGAVLYFLRKRQLQHK